MTMKYGRNGKISSRWMLTRLAGDGLLFFAPSNTVYRSGRHEITGLSFSAEVKRDAAICADLKTIVEEFMYFAYDVENTETLRTDIREIPGEAWRLLGYEDLTGLSYFRLLREKKICLSFPDEETVIVEADETLCGLIPDFFGRLEKFLHVCFAYSGDDCDFRMLVNRHEIRCTETVTDDLRVTYLSEDYLDERFSPKGAGTAADAASEKELAPRRQVTETLIGLRSMMDELSDRKTGLIESVLSKGLSYSAGRTALFGRYAAEIPDGFRYSLPEAERPFIMWLPNEDNPDEWEASVLSVYQETENDNDGDFVFYSVCSGEFTRERAEKLKTEILSHIKETSWQA